MLRNMKFYKPVSRMLPKSRQKNDDQIDHSSSVKLNQRKAMKERLIRKLKNNDHLTGEEREFLFHVVETLNDQHLGLHAKPLKTQSVDESCQTKWTTYEVEDFIEYMKNNKPDDPIKAPKIDTLMRCTFMYRRNFIIATNAKVLVVKESFPRLFDYDQVEKDLDRICGTVNNPLSKKLCRSLKKHCSAIFSKLSSHENVQYIQEIIADMKGEYSDKVRKATEDAVLLCIPYLFDENLEDIIVFQNQRNRKINTPFIVCNKTLREALNGLGSYKIFVEGIELCVTKDIQKAFIALFGGYFIFHINYPRGCHQSLMFLQRGFLKLPLLEEDASDLTSKVEECLKDIEEFQSELSETEEHM